MNSLHKPVVMVVDPDPLTLTAISAMLDCANLQVYCAQDRGAALKGAAALALDLIVCDEDVDDCHGDSLIAELRQIPDREDVPIMFMSRRQLPDIISRPHDGGAAYHIRKPVEPSRLLEKINQALYELPLINNQVKQNKPRAPHFPVTAIASIPNVAMYAVD
jgi:CheY-like chemotaxis protein